MNFFVSKAFADTGDAAQQGITLSLVIMLAVFGLIFYFMIFRPQQKRAKEHRERMASIVVGSEVLTVGGIVGRVTKVNDNGYIVLELNDSYEIIIKCDYVAAVLPKGTIKSI